MTPQQDSLSGVIICPAYVEGQRLRVNSFTVLTQLLHIQMRRSVKWLDGQIYGSCDDCIVFFWRTSRNHARERQVSSSLHSSTANSCTRSSSGLLIRIATLEFTARLEETAGPKTCDAFPKAAALQNEDPSLPLERRVLLGPLGEMGRSFGC